MKKLSALGALLSCGTFLHAAEIVLPQERSAFYASEPLEVAVAGLEKGAKANVEISPAAGASSSSVQWTVEGDGSSVVHVLSPGSLAPGKYSIKLDGKDAAPLIVSSGVVTSTMPLSQVSRKAIADGGNFLVANAFGFGLLDPKGAPLLDVRGKKSGGIASMEKMMSEGFPAICYMYWTGFVTHKPFGTMKSWANAEMQDSMRALNFSTAQRLRRYSPLWLAVGPIDEPGLSWGRTPAGGMASGFPNADEKPWYEARGWKFTQDIANQSDADWMKYIDVRCGILKESYQQAKDDIQSTWPTATFGGDLYAPSAIMDGCDTLNQQVNKTPTTHVFFDFFGGPMSVPGLFYLEKSGEPTAKLAHAMNGQLEGARGPQRPLYHWLMNGMVQGGLDSNWWLNTGGMTSEDLQAVNDPVAAYGPLFHELSLDHHDVAILWGFTELAMRQKETARLESTKKGGAQIKLMLPMPDSSEMKEGEIVVSPYEVGGVYSGELLRLHQTLRRAGYAPHIVHEALLPGGVLKNYKVLFIVGQDTEPSDAVKSALADFVKDGGMILVDKSSKAKIAGATILDVDLSATALRQFDVLNASKMKDGPNKREESLYGTNFIHDEQWKGIIAPVKAAMKKTDAKAIIDTDATSLSVEQHYGGQAKLTMVLNGFEKLPDGIAEDQAYPKYNPAPASYTYTLQGIPKGSSVWCIEGLDWKKVTKLADPSAPIKADFAAGEMKLYLIAPSTPRLALKVKAEAAKIAVGVSLGDAKMSWPLTVSVIAPDGKMLYTVQRSTDKTGRYAEQFPVGTNAKAGEYLVKVESPVGPLKAESKVDFAPKALIPNLVTGSVRVRDGDAISKFLSAKPEVTIAVASDAQKRAAEKLAAALSAKGIKATAKPEAGLLRKEVYPRVFNPTVQVYTVGGEEKVPSGEVKENVALDPSFVGEWRTKNTLATVGSEGFLDWQNRDKETAYGPGVKIYIDDKNQLTVLNATVTEVPADEAFRAKWCKPWTRLGSYVGGLQLPAQLPEAYKADSHLIVLGDSQSSGIAAVLQASEILPQVADAKYPGPGKALIQFAWSPFAIGKNVIFIGASDSAGIEAGAQALAEMVK